MPRRRVLKRALPEIDLYSSANMDFCLLAYQQIDPTTWAAAASVLMLSIFFKFNRIWSVRNFDLLLIISMAPFLLMVNHGMNLANQHQLDTAIPTVAGTSDTIRVSPFVQSTSVTNASEEISADTESPGRAMQRTGFIGLFVVGALYLIRMLIDPVLVRRPLLNPNLSLGGLIFLGVCLIMLLLANIFSAKPTTDEVSMVKSTIRMAKRQAADEAESLSLRKRGPGYQMLFFVAVISVFSDNDQVDDIVIDQETNLERYILVLKILAIVSQSLIVLGLILFAVYNFNSFYICLLYTSPSPRDATLSRMPSSA